MTGKSSSAQPCCWVNGCQRTLRSRSWRSGSLMRAKLEARAVGISSLRRTVPELCRETRESVPPAAAARFWPYPRRVPARRIQLLAAVVGSASLGAEIAAARLLAPWFGASTVIWANTIATVLVALSAGYWVGGRLADRDPTLAGLSRVVL